MPATFLISWSWEALTMTPPRRVRTGHFTKEHRSQRMPFRIGRAYCWLVGVRLLIAATVAYADDGSARLFENEVRPILVEHCTRCHGSRKQASGLRLDSRRALLQGGERGAAIVPGNPGASRLIQAVRRDAELEMPPERALSDREVDVLERWVELGATWPTAAVPLQTATGEDATEHWGFQPIRDPDVPITGNAKWLRNPIDAFVLAKLEAAGLKPAPRADRRSLIRRVSYSLTGLPPSPAEVAAFVKDTDPNAYDRLVERLLQSPRCGEHWARHWLDVARYSDTKGYVYAREERFWVHAWAYRDWVVEALNADLPYDRFLLLQLAADQVEDRQEGDLAAMGFLTLGRRFLGVTRDIIDDRIDVVCRGTMGLTVGCARCHDHKYDPIPTADYYSLYGVFASSEERRVALRSHASGRSASADESFASELRSREEKLRNRLAACRAESSARVRDRIADYLHAQTELHQYPAEGFDQIFQKTDLLPAFVRRWEAYLREARRRQDPVFVPWHAFRNLDDDSFAERAVELTQRWQSSSQSTVNTLVARAFATAPSTFQEVIQRYAELFGKIDARWIGLIRRAEIAATEPPRRFTDAAAEQLRRVLYGPGAPCEVPDQPIVHSEVYFDSDSCTELWKLQGEVDRWIIQASSELPYALTLQDQPFAVTPRIFRRGNPLRPGDEVPRQFLSLLAGEDREPFRQGSGRLELAHAIIDRGNPLTARVIVNRVWARHFGEGLVTTPSDFGRRSDSPSHAALLDWLATRLVAEGWSLKKLHRRIVQSATFCQASSGPLALPVRARALEIDPDNRLLWRMNQRRLSFEECRDSFLSASGELDGWMGGRAVKLFEQPFPRRRTLYGLVDRQFLPGTLRMFDFANPDLHIPRRSETTVPQQALFFMNHSLVLEQIRAIAHHARSETTPAKAITALFQRTLQREPTPEEVSEAWDLVQSTCAGETAGGDSEGKGEDADRSTSDIAVEPASPLTGWDLLAQVLLCSNEFLFVD